MTDKTRLRELARGLGIGAIGVTDASPLDSSRFHGWVAKGCHGRMGYLERDINVRHDPGLLLPGARSVVCCAVSYAHPGLGELHVAEYALGEDYHQVLPRLMQPLAQTIGGQWLLAVDALPVAERYLAWKAGLGWIGRNGMLIVSGLGSRVVLGEIITTAVITPDRPLAGDCGNCGACVTACPTRAICPESHGIDARRCLSYLTIECQGRLPEDTPSLHGRLAGCDACQRVCPHNYGVPETPVEAFTPFPQLTELTPERALTLTRPQYKALAEGTALSRVRLRQLKRNARHQ